MKTQWYSGLYCSGRLIKRMDKIVGLFLYIVLFRYTENLPCNSKLLFQLGGGEYRCSWLMPQK